MRRKVYDKPSMKVVKIQATHMLMTSGVEASRGGYGTANEGMGAGEDTWE